MSKERLPKALRRQLEEAEQIEAKIAEEQANPPPREPSIEEVLAQHAQEQPKPNDEPKQSAPATSAEQPQAPATPAPAPAPAPAPKSNDDEETWKKRYLTLQGMFNKQVPQLQAEVQRLSAQLAAVTQQKPAEPQQPAVPKVDPKDVEAFGQEWVDMVHRYAERAVQPVYAKLAELTQRIANLEQGVHTAAQTATASAEQVFEQQLTSLVPNWREINSLDHFWQWLQIKDPMYGRKRMDALDEAADTFNAQQAAAVFKAYINETTPQQPQPQPTTPAPSGLESQVAPSAVQSGAVPNMPQQPVFTQQMVKQFYDDAARGKYANRPHDYARIEAEINAALREGRVI